MKFRFKTKRVGKPSELSRLMESVIKETGLEEDYIVHYMKRNWNTIVGEILATHSIPFKKYGNLLVIYTDHPVFANDIAMQKQQIIEKINKMNGISSITDIKVDVNKKIRW